MQRTHERARCTRDCVPPRVWPVSSMGPGRYWKPELRQQRLREADIILMSKTDPARALGLEWI
jgi:hypothetical protein